MTKSDRYVELVNRCRTHCLWFTASNVVPRDRDAQLYTLTCIERYGGRSDFVEARKLKQWLSQHTSEAFAVS